MLFGAAEESFQKGLHALAAGQRRQAMALFEAAIELERRLGGRRPQARYLSYYGLCLGLELHEVPEGLRFCREAVTLEPYNPDARYNLGRLLFIAGRRKEAHEALCKGLKLQPQHRGIRIALRDMGLRRRPVLPFLGRRHPLNVLLGRLRGPAGRAPNALAPARAVAQSLSAAS
jgi:tetratricopeptide (TPR) repeat protein